ncbi:MAG TPA: cohesin domain-containing protein, partial [Dehalococcoidia bacterium]|nr:cohesin domain-containing protein [Dehalococcoidia bacterium]
MRHGFVRLPPLIAALVLVALLATIAAAAPAQSGSAVQLIALDADPSGNTATSLGHLDPCIRTGLGQEVTVDLVVDAVPKDRPLVGWGVGIKYDSDLLEVTADDKAFLLAADGAFEPFDVSDSLPDSDGVYSMTIADLASYNPEGGNSETGPGVLARLTFRSKSPGLATVIPGYPTLIDLKNSTIDVRTIASIHIAVGQECPPGPDIQPTSLPPPPTHPPLPSPTGDVTPQPTPPHLHSTIGLVAMDADPAGNTPTGLGHLDPCVRAEPDSEVTVDIVVDAVPADRPIVGFQIGVNYSGGLMAIAEDNHFLLGANGTFQPFSGLSDPLPDADGHLAIIVADLASNDPEGANMETGPGVLSRVTFRTTHPGIFDLAPGFSAPDEYPAL